jgi:hypothetical protein
MDTLKNTNLQITVKIIPILIVLFWYIYISFAAVFLTRMFTADLYGSVFQLYRLRYWF